MSLQNYGIDKVFPPWKGSFYRLISLWEIMDALKGYACEMANYLVVLEILQKRVAKLGNKNIDENLWDLISGWLDSIMPHDDKPNTLKELGLTGSLAAIEIAKRMIKEPTPTKVVSSHLDIIGRTVLKELKGVMFLHIKPDRVGYYNNISIVNELTTQNFKHASREIKRGGEAYACGLHTATVFHCMRALEHGLRALAQSKELNISFSSELELENWKNIIDPIEKKIRDMEQQQKSMIKSENLQFYATAAIQFFYFKEAWRNHVSHSRISYEEHEAYRILTHVIDFFEHISKRLAET